MTELQDLVLQSLVLILTLLRIIKLGYLVITRFRITQHVRDRALFDLIVSCLNCGFIETARDVVVFRVSSHNDIINIIIPLFEKYPIQGNKYLDYADFMKVALLMKNKVHLTPEGLDQIRKIKAGMNTGRELNSS